MRVPDEVLQGVTFVCYRDGSGTISLAGTGFIVGKEVGREGETDAVFLYTITAKHVLDGIRKKTVDDKVYLRLNTIDNGARLFRTDIDNWLSHPEDSVDAVAAHTQLPLDDLDTLYIPNDTLATQQVINEKNIGVGDEVFITGLFIHHFGEERNQPIIRIGNISMLDGEPVTVEGFGSMDAYLIESRSLGGLSGSPVFVHLPPLKPTVSVGKFYLIGLVHGHWDIPISLVDNFVKDQKTENAVNVGIAIVVPAIKILEIINQSAFREIRQQKLD